MANTLDFSYPAILTLFEKHTGSGRTESQAFLVWFLENYFRLDEVDANDAVCDGPDDKGIDGIYVDNNLETIGFKGMNAPITVEEDGGNVPARRCQARVFRDG